MLLFIPSLDRLGALEEVSGGVGFRRVGLRGESSSDSSERSEVSNRCLFTEEDMLERGEGFGFVGVRKKAGVELLFPPRELEEMELSGVK